MNAITLLDGSLKLSIYYDASDREFDDDICLSFEEDCPEEEKLFKADEVSLYLTPEQTALIVLELNRALQAYRHDQTTDEGRAPG
ncbi:protein of unknown function [Candidatus Promineifilum breve]|uniref:Uncharacterized protein n=1 Tax=Candidatus Promineifilum breve TaxID=1806508 RepID=A0A160SYR6_9CHLR|nr:hypothetical protein [Candidatus Promineifilum breve]CUS02224.2 protein of unknown function [Candidatus Promineifilum breve]